MADRIYKGALVTQQPDEDFPEAATSFDSPHAGGLVPFEVLKDILTAPKAGGGIVNGSLFITDNDAWIKIDPDGSIEIGASGV
jgi:hypothetical protein